MAEVELKALPFEEARQFWADKVQLGPGQFNLLADEAKLRAFAVSGIAKGDELATVYGALKKAMDSGISLGQFKDECAAIFERRGWTGRRAWRVDTIFRTNIQTAYNVGRYKQMAATTADFPYWQYDAINDSRTRPTHLALDGRVFPAEHPFWDQWYPPNGFRCRCSVMPLTRGQVERRGLTVETDDPTNTPVFPIDPRTGLKMVTPVNLLPDPGFAYHPGKAYWGGRATSGRGGLYAPLAGLRGPADYRRPALANARPAGLPDFSADMLLPAGEADAFYQAEFIARYGEARIIKDKIGDAVLLSMRSFLVGKTPGAAAAWKFAKPGHGEIIPLLAAMVAEPYEIWLTPQANAAGRIRLAKRYVSLWKTEDKARIGGLVVFEVADGEWQGVTAFTPLKDGAPDLSYVERQRSGLLLYGR